MWFITPWVACVGLERGSYIVYVCGLFFGSLWRTTQWYPVWDSGAVLSMYIPSVLVFWFVFGDMRWSIEWYGVTEGVGKFGILWIIQRMSSSYNVCSG